MGDVGHAQQAEAAQGLARQARSASARLDEHRAALARSALVWWEGGAAQACQEAVLERVNGLASLSRRLSALAARYDALAAEEHLAAVTDGAVASPRGAPLP